MVGKWVALSGDTIRNRDTLTAINMDHVADVRFGHGGKVSLTFSYGHAVQLEEADAQIIRKWLNDEMLEEAGEV